jgi:HemY protein
MESSDQGAIGAVVAARAAHALRAYDRRDEYLDRALAVSPGDPAGTIARAELLLEERRSAEALAALADLPQKHTAALKLELVAQQMERNWAAVVDLTGQLERRNVYDAEQSARLRRHALAENLKRKALDLHALDEEWRKVPDEDRKDPRVAAAAARCYLALGGGTRAQQIVEQSLEAHWDSELVGLYAECAGPDPVRQIQRAEGWLAREPRDAALLLTLGKLCARQTLWGKAQSYVDASLSIEPTYSAHLVAAELQDTLGNTEAARRHYRASLDLALAQLRQSTGGRRRTPL